MELKEALDFAAGRHHGVLITLRRDGRAQSSDVSYAIVDGTIRISVTADRAKTANMARDPRVVFHISDPSAYTYLSFDGTAVVSPSATAPDDPQIDDLVDLYRAVGGKEHPDWDEYRRAMVDDRRAVVTITPTSVVGMINA